MKKIAFILLALLFSLSTLLADINEEIFVITQMYNDGFFELALREILKIEHRLTSDDMSNQIFMLKADILMKRGENDEAKDILERLSTLPLKPTLEADVMLTFAMIERSLHNDEHAFELAKDFAERFPDNQRINVAHQLMGDIYIEQGRVDEAEKLYLDLHRTNRSEQTYINLIKLYIALDDLPKAESNLSTLGKVYPVAYDFQQQGLLLLLSAYESKGQYQKILEMCPDTFDETTQFTEDILMKKVAAYIDLKNFIDAERLLGQIKKDSASVEYYRALIHKESGRDNQALLIFRRLSQSDTPPHIKSASFFNVVNITAKENPEEAYNMLQNFLIENPDQDWEGDVLYQLATIEFQNDKFTEAYEYVQQALRFKLSPINKQSAIFLKGELEFLLKDYEQSLQSFAEYLANTPLSLVDEAIFKQGMNYYSLALPDSASRNFTRLITTYPGSDKIGIAYFYLGELELHRNLNFARSNYQQALSGPMDRGVIQLRLAYIDYLRKNYNAALESLNAVPETSDYLFDKNLLRGNIYFAQKDYPAAFDAYRIAERNAQDRASVEYIWSRQAWAQYSLGNYDAATAIYRRLAEQSDTPGRYALSAASAAFNADRFEEAIEQYLEFIATYPDSPELIRAQSALANSYFNLARYQEAIDVWENLVHEDNDPNIVESSLKGLQVSFQRLNRIPLFIEFLNWARIRNNKKEFRIYIFEYKATFEYEQKNYNASIATLNELIRLYPEKGDEQKIMIMLANNYTWLNRYTEADDIYLQLSRRGTDPYVYYEWGNIKWAQGDYEAAITRYKRAADNSKNEQYWLTLLERLVERKDNDFIRYYNQFITFGSAYHKVLVLFNLIDYNINTNNLSEAMRIADEILSSSYSQLRARATFKKAEIYYLQRSYEEALSNFLRIRYIFSEHSDLRWESELYIIKIYLAQGDRQRARNHFESIRANLKPNQIAEINALVN